MFAAADAEKAQARTNEKQSYLTRSVPMRYVPQVPSARLAVIGNTPSAFPLKSRRPAVQILHSQRSRGFSSTSCTSGSEKRSVLQKKCGLAYTTFPGDGGKIHGRENMFTRIRKQVFFIFKVSMNTIILYNLTTFLGSHEMPIC